MVVIHQVSWRLWNGVEHARTFPRRCLHLESKSKLAEGRQRERLKFNDDVNGEVVSSSVELINIRLALLRIAGFV